MRAAQDDRHVSSETAVRLRELERDRSGPDADEVSRELGRLQQVVAGHEGDAVEPGQIGDARARACRDQQIVELDRLAPAVDLMLADDTSVTAEERRALIALDHVLVEGDTVVDHLTHAGHHGLEVDLHGTDTDAELVRAAGVVRYLGGPDQGLRGDTPPSDSGATDRAALEERDSGSAAPGHPNACPAAHAAADHCDVVSLASFHGPSAIDRAVGSWPRRAERGSCSGEDRRREVVSPPPLEEADCRRQIALVTGVDPGSPPGDSRARVSRGRAPPVADVPVVGVAPDEAAAARRLRAHHRMAGFVEMRSRVPALRVAAADVAAGRADPEADARAAFLTRIRARSLVLLGHVVTGREFQGVSQSLQHGDPPEKGFLL